MIVFNEKKFNEIISNPGTQLNDCKNTVVFNQYKSIENQNKDKKPKSKTLKCFICMRNFSNEHNFNQHMNSKYHEKLNTVSQNDKGGFIKLEVLLSGNPTRKSVIPVKKNRFPAIKLSLINDTANSCQILDIQTIADVLQVNPNISFPFALEGKSFCDIGTDLIISDDKVAVIEIIGYSYKDSNGKIFKSSKKLSFVVTDEYYEEYYPIVEYKRKQRTLIKELDCEIVKGIPLTYENNSRPKIRLGKYEIPTNLNKVFNAGFKIYNGINKNVEEELKSVKKLLNVKDHKTCLSLNNYTKLLPVMLYLEEHQMNLDIRQFDMITKDLKKVNNNLYQLKVPGLAEQRPSIVRGDSVFIREENQTSKTYEGIVHNIYETFVDLGFHQDFQKIHVPNKNFSVIFSFSRLPMRVQHQAVQVTKRDDLIRIFPKSSVIQKAYELKPLHLFNRSIRKNREQLQAVQHICQNSSGTYPYLIFGPPGTGKTSTLVEAIKQLYFSEKSLKMLVCATSNDAVNAITNKLIEIAPIPKTDLLRYVSYSYSMQNVSDLLRKYINVTRNEFYQPSLQNMQNMKIITTTLVNAARIYNMGAKESFDYVFIDEAGHATETETLIPITCLLKRNGHIILAGDHEQLGPIIHSPIAREYGFDISMLERLMKFNIYKKNDDGKYNPVYVTKLLNNYRSHPAILKIPSELFYDGELIAKADTNLINLAVGGSYDVLKNKNFPVIFHNVVGKDMRENVSPSFFNINELEIVDKYLQTLYSCKLSGRKIMGQDIGIVTPYRRQMQKLDSMCKKRGYKDITVGSVEQFQGQEKLIIIISTVRSQSNLLHFDHKFHLGFVSNKKRFNVALTRAKALLIVVGNGDLLQLDPRFYEFIKYCHDNNAIYGQNLIIGDPPEEHPETNLLNIFEDEVTENHIDNINFSNGNI